MQWVHPLSLALAGITFIACATTGPDATWGPRDVAIERAQLGLSAGREQCSARAVLSSGMCMHECEERLERSLSYCPELVSRELPSIITMHQRQYVFIQLFGCRATLMSGTAEYEPQPFETWAKAHPYFDPKPD